MVKRRRTRFDKAQAYRRSRELEKIATKFRNELLDLETPAEVLFKSYLIKLKIRYEFQKIIYAGKSFYIVDFFIPRKAVAIEIDGRQHSEEENVIKDLERTLDLKMVGIKEVYRFSNDEVFDYEPCLNKLKKILGIYTKVKKK